uniref:Uncharacterized protein n=1 Tax=Anguilla anguilla TaxID=7936 RepID=A0A0E9Q2Y5_ANGAN
MAVVGLLLLTGLNERLMKVCVCN